MRCDGSDEDLEAPRDDGSKEWFPSSLATIDHADFHDELADGQQPQEPDVQVDRTPLEIAQANAETSDARDKKKSSHYGDIPTPGRSEHLGSSRQYMRDLILGVNDGLVSTFLLVAGVAGGGLSSKDILLTAIAGAIAGAVSMCAGEYVATKSQNEVMEGEIALEKEHVARYLEAEVSEVGNLLELIGIPKEEGGINDELCDYYRQHPTALLKIMIALEFGVVQAERRSPFRAGGFSCVLFLIGALPSVVPFCFSVKPVQGLIAAAVITMAALLVVGAVKTWATRGNCVTAAMENLVIAGFGGGFAYGVGVAFDKLLHNK